MSGLGHLLQKRDVGATSAFPLIATNRGRADTSQKCQIRTWPLSPMRCVSGVAAWIVTNKADGLGLNFSATDAECACGFDRTVDDRTITMARSSFRRRGESTPCARANPHDGVFSLRPPPPRPWSQCLMSAAHMRPAD